MGRGGAGRVGTGRNETVRNGTGNYGMERDRTGGMLGQDSHSSYDY